MESLQQLIKKKKWEMIIKGLIGIALGVVLIVIPNESALALNKIVGIGLIVLGVISLIRRIVSKLPEEGASITGVTMILMGIFCALNPDTVQIVINVGFGILIAVDGTILLENSILLVRNQIKCGIVALILSILLIALGFVTALNHFNFVMRFSGAAMVLTGILDIVIAIVFCKKIQELREALKKTALGQIMD